MGSYMTWYSRQVERQRGKRSKGKISVIMRASRLLVLVFVFVFVFLVFFVFAFV